GHITVKTQRNTLEKFNRIVILKENYSKNDYYPYLSSVKDTNTIKISLNKLPKSIKKITKTDVEYLIPDIISNRFLGERLFFIEGGKFVVSDTFFVAVLKKDYKKENVCGLLNSTLSLFITEIIGRKNLGGGLLTIYGPELNKLLLLDSKKLDENDLNIIKNCYSKLSIRKVKSIFEELNLDPNKFIREQEPNPLPDRKALDDVVFDALGLTEAERKEVYWAVCELVQNRLNKAKSV
nr:hypothetical protein [Candidatus Cloacimonadota bacterium]